MKRIATASSAARFEVSFECKRCGFKGRARVHGEGTSTVRGATYSEGERSALLSGAQAEAVANAETDAQLIAEMSPCPRCGRRAAFAFVLAISVLGVSFWLAVSGGLLWMVYSDRTGVDGWWYAVVAVPFFFALRSGARFLRRSREANAIEIVELGEVVELLVAEANGSENSKQRVALLRQAAAIASGELGRWDDAKNLLERALAIDPHDIECIDQMSSLHTAREEWPEIVGLLSRTLEAGVDRPAQGSFGARRRYDFELLLHRGGVLAEKMGRLDQAVEDYRRVIEADPAQAEAWDGLLACLRRIGDKERLLRALEQRAATAPDTDTRIAAMLEVDRVRSSV